jgi:hypothetical protein
MQVVRRSLRLVDSRRFRVVSGGADRANELDRDAFVLDLIWRHGGGGSTETTVGQPGGSLNAIAKTSPGDLATKYAQHELDKFVALIRGLADRVDEAARASAWVTADALRERTAEDANRCSVAVLNDADASVYLAAERSHHDGERGRRTACGEATPTVCSRGLNGCPNPPAKIDPCPSWSRIRTF